MCGRIEQYQMLRKSRYDTNNWQELKRLEHCDSTSTEASDSPRCSHVQARARHSDKEKLELCKKFMEYGFCPYRNKCKFAHGSHELRKNNQKNKLYKTKECVGFFQDGHCSYGDRCNFKHRKESQLEGEKRKTAWQNFREVLLETRQESRLLQLIRGA